MKVIILIGVLWSTPSLAEPMISSFYGGKFIGRKTASGETYHRSDMTAAHRSLPFGTRLLVCLHGCVEVRVNNRGPFIRGRSLDLSLAAATQIGLLKLGVAQVEVTHQ